MEGRPQGGKPSGWGGRGGANSNKFGGAQYVKKQPQSAKADKPKLQQCEIKKREGNDVCRLYVVVLGKRLKKNGSPELCLIERMNFALQILQDRQPGMLLMSGSAVEKKAKITEAECMTRLAAEAGVDESLILREEVSWNTFSNAFCCKRVLLERITDRSQPTTVIVVTSDFHGGRVKKVFEAVFADTGDFISLGFENSKSHLTENQTAREARAESQMLAKFDADLERHLAMKW